MDVMPTTTAVTGAAGSVRALRRWLICAALPVVAACASGADKPPVGINLAVSRPASAEDNPFTLAGDKFVAITAEVPGKPDGEYRVVKPYKAGMALDLECAGTKCVGIPYTAGVQVRVELWSSNNGQISPPVVGRGRSVAVDVLTKGSAAKKVSPYVTRTNRFAPAEGATGTAAIIPGLAGSAAVAQRTSDGGVLIIGGAEALPGKTDAYNAASYTNFSDAIAKYLPNERLAGMSSDLGPEHRLKTGRAFHGAAAGKSVIAVVGGYVVGEKGPKVTGTIEYIGAGDKVFTSKSGSPDLKIARAGATVIALFDDDDYFLILGGKGEANCKTETYCAGNTWELWHKDQGNVAQGQLNTARWNHASVRLPAADGGYVMLIGGENEDGVLQTFEVIQFSKQGVVSQKGQVCNEAIKIFGPCDKTSFMWEPLTQSLPVARTLPGAAFVSVPRGSQALDYRHVYIVGGYEDAKHTKPIARMDVFNIDDGNYLNADGWPMQVARGAPMVAVVPHGPNEGQVLIAGGSKDDTKHISSAEFVYVTVDRATGKPVPSIQLVPVENDMPGGGRALGNVVTLNTGHVLLSGGMGVGANNDLTGQNELALWNPF